MDTSDYQHYPELREKSIFHLSNHYVSKQEYGDAPSSIPIVPTDDPENETPGYIETLTRNITLSDIPYPFKTIPELLDYRLPEFYDHDALGSRQFDGIAFTDYNYINYREFVDSRKKLSAGLEHVLSKFCNWNIDDSGAILAIQSENRPQWILTDIAIAYRNHISTQLYDTLGIGSSEYILNQTDSPIVLCSAVHIGSIISLKHKCKSLKVIISFDSLDKSIDPKSRPLIKTRSLYEKRLQENDLILLDFDEVLRLGENFPCEDRIPSPFDTWTINYTSGTTGPPKGVTLPHRAIYQMVVSSNLKFVNKGTHYSMLPLAHIFERTATIASIASGDAIAFPSNGVLNFIEDMQVAKPDTVCFVPRILSKIVGAFKGTFLEGRGILANLGRRAFEDKMANLENYGKADHILWDRTICRIARSVLGGNIAYIIVGGAAASKTDIQIARIFLNCKIVNGYGMTETCALTMLQTFDDYSLNKVGPPAPMIEARLRSVPEMSFTIYDKPRPRGELLIKGNTTFTGYYKNDEETKKSLDSRGFVCTGDIAEVDENGLFSIIDRKKSLIKLSQGEYISPEKIEAICTRLYYISQCWVYGDSDHSFCVAVLGVCPDNFPVFLSEKFPKLDVATALNNTNVRLFIKKELDRQFRSERLNELEKFKEFKLMQEPFTISNGTLTPTMKLQRNKAVQLYNELIEELFREGSKKLKKNSML